jgi:hypothetical protein
VARVFPGGNLARVMEGVVPAEAVRTGDQETFEWLFGVIGERNAKENALFNELGGQCVEA